MPDINETPYIEDAPIIPVLPISETFIDQAHVTCSDKFYLEKVPAADLQAALRDFIASAERLDLIKKSLFYGRDLPEDFPHLKVENQPQMAKVNPNIIHGIIGIATEAGELVEALDSGLFAAALFEAPEIDMVNVCEEIGDVLWYQAILARVANQTFDSMMQTVINKLRKRFGDKFSEFDANNRNLDAERAILEAGMTPEQAQKKITLMAS